MSQTPKTILFLPKLFNIKSRMIYLNPYTDQVGLAIFKERNTIKYQIRKLVVNLPQDLIILFLRIYPQMIHHATKISAQLCSLWFYS